MRRGVGGQAGQSSSGEEDKREEGEGGGYCSRSTPPLWRVKKKSRVKAVTVALSHPPPTHPPKQEK